MFAIADRRVHMQCSLTTFSPCSNGVCKKSIVGGMHETAKRLLELGLARGAKDFTEIARSLGGSDQSATNWKTRGVPKAVIIEAAKKYRVDVGWLSADAQAVEPAFITRWKDGERGVAPVKNQATQKVEQTRNPYLLPSDEQTILDGFRLADDGVKRSMLLLAKDALERFGMRSKNHL